MVSRRNYLILPIAVLAAMTISACQDTSDPEPEPEIATLRLTVGTGAGAQTVNVAEANCAASAQIMLTINTTTPISASFLNAAGQADAIANDPDIFVLAGATSVGGTTVAPEPVPTPSTITWARTGSFAGTLRGTATTTTGSVTFSALHIEEGHADFECAVSIRVQ
jgi:hypothetical protein